MSVVILAAGLNFAIVSSAVAQPTLAADCQASQVVSAPDALHDDPFEKPNRALFAFNDKLDHALLAPAASGYVHVVPQLLRTGIGNFFGNLGEVGVFANDALQFKPKQAASTLARFATNTTVGIAGVFDPATHFGLPHHNNDFGLTLGHLKIGPGPYLFLPFVGPSDVRDLVGSVVDIAFQPLTWSRFDGRETVQIAGVVTTGLQQRADAGPALDALRDTSLDPYVSLRSAYLQSRRSLTYGGTLPLDQLPDFDTPDAQPEAPDASPPAAAAKP